MTPRPTPKVLGVGSILPLATVLLAGTTITLATLSSFGVFSATTAMGEHSLPPAPAELGAALASVGITAESLTAAGVQSAGAAAVVANARNYLDAERFLSLNNAQDDWKSARREVDRLEGLVRAGNASDQDLTDLSRARSDLTAATTARESLLTSLRQAAVANLTGEQSRILARLAANAAPGVEMSFLVNDRTQAEWVTLREAAANIRVADKLGEDPDYACSQLVTRTRAEPEVAAAQSRLVTRLPEVRLAFEQALEG